MSTIALALIWLLCAPCAAAVPDDVISVSPEALGEPTATRDITGQETFVIETGMHRGRKGLKQDIPAFEMAPVKYRLAYNVTKDPEAYPGTIDVWPREGGLGIGLSGPTGANWYGGGFIDLLINGVSPGPRQPTVEVRDYASGRTVAFTWDTPDAVATLEFTATETHRQHFLTGRIAPRRQIGSLRLTLRAFPSAYGEERDRWIATPRRELQHDRTVTLAPEEYWVLAYDTVYDEAQRPAEAAGPCAVAFSPLEVRRAKVRVAQYPVEVDLELRRQLREFHLALWEFPNVSNQAALAAMRALPESISAPRVQVLAAETPRTLALEGRAAATVVIPADASPQEELAAQELQDAIYDMSGALLPIQPDNGQAAGCRVHIGNTQQAEQAGLTMDKRRAADAGFRLKTLEGDVYITAEADIATLYGVCELLQKLGMRWFMPGPVGTVTPSLPTIVLPELDEEQRPSFPMRWVGREDWAYRNKCNNVRGDGEQSWGFNIRPGVYHADYTLLPVDEYYPRHPEYFALVNGERCSEKDTKLCVSNPEVVAEVAANMGKILDADPTIDLIGLAPTDGTNYCECEHCVAMDDVGERPADQKYSRRMLLYYNAVARELAKTHPDATILAGAYHWYNQAPLDGGIRAEPNLSLVICHYTEYCSMHPIEQADCPRNQRYRDLLASWDRLIPDIYYYEYYYTDGFRQFPCNLVHAIRRDIPYFHRRGDKGLYTQYGNIWNTHLNYYVAARLLWDVGADVDALLEDFYTRFYGPAAVPMKAYYELCSRVLAQTDRHLCTCSGGGIDMRVIFTDEVVARMQELSDRAMGLADTDIVRQRLEKIAACVEYTRRFTEYLDAYYAAASGTDRGQRAEDAQRALELVEGLQAEVAADRGKWDGVVAPSSYHWKSDLRAARRLADSLRPRQAPGDAIGTLPDRWRFRLDEGNIGVAERWYRPDLDEGDWEELLVTKHWEYQGHADYDGFAWYRTSLTLTADQAGAQPALHFAGVDAEAWVYLDGREIGHHDGWDEPFAISIPADLTEADREMVLAVRVYDSSNDGGFYGPVTLVRAKPSRSE